MRKVNANTIDLETAGGGPPVFAQSWTLPWMKMKAIFAYNRLRRVFVGFPKRARPNYEGLSTIQNVARRPSDINEHLEILFAEALAVQPRLIVEMGVRSGSSTLVFSQVAAITDGSIISIDLDDCSTVSTLNKWHFVQSDDVAFAAQFPEYCRKLGIASQIDLLYIDTSHYYQHTKAEIGAWFPLVSDSAKIIFHDTNMGIGGPRKDGCYSVSWDNRRGVIRAIEDFLGVKLNEKVDFVDYANGWLIRHHANCNGLTILQRVRPS